MFSPTSGHALPNFQPVNTVDLVSVENSKITGVSVYSGRAEITRLFKFSAKTGQNQLNIAGLPAALEQDSFKVEGRGAATIHDVTISKLCRPTTSTISPSLTTLLLRKNRTEKALARTLRSLSSLEAYITSLKAESLDASKLKEVVQHYDSTAAELDEKVSELESDLKNIEEAIVQGRKDVAGPPFNDELDMKAIIHVFADADAEIEIALIYTVRYATWHAVYDVRVDMQTKDKPVTLIYKASITQSTGEDWDNVPLTLETVAPTYGLGVPTLSPWNLSIYRPVYKSMPSNPPIGIPMSAALPGVGPQTVILSDWRAGRSRSRSPRSSRSRSLSPRFRRSFEPMEHRGLLVSSKGTVSATFRIPGLITIPNDGVGHKVTVVKLILDASMSWVCVPKADTRVHLKAKVKNASEYSLLPGAASVYVDGSFISKSDIPLVSPEESFDCSLGLDSSIRIVYHPRTKKVSETGFYSKSFNQTFIQRITVHNTKPNTSDKGPNNVEIRIMDQVPVSEDSAIAVKVVQPALTLPNREGTSSVASGKNNELKVSSPIKVSSGVMAMWEGADKLANGTADEIAALGRDGRFSWICDIPSQLKIGLTLQWEVSAPARSNILGL